MVLFDIIDKYKEEIINSLIQILKYKSVAVSRNNGHPYGDETYGCLQHILNLSQSMGFNTCDVGGYVGWAEYGDGEEMEAVLCHLDVVPAGEGWNYEPFDGTIEKGKIYGRGTTDDKGPAIAALYALKAIKDSGIKINKRIRIIFGCGEEIGAKDMVYYVENGGEKPVCGFTPDGEYPLINGEKGIVTETYRCVIEEGYIASMTGGTASNMVPDYAKAILADGTIIESKGKCAHGSTPEKGINAICRLIHQLNKIEQLPSKIKKAVNFIDCKIGEDTTGRDLGVYLHDEVSGDLSFNVGTINSDGKTMEIVVNYRYPVTKTPDECIPIVRREFKEAGFELVESQVMDKLYVPQSDEMVKTLLEIYNRYTGKQEKAICIGGGTYAKCLPNIVAFGPIFPGEEITEHEANEYISIEHLIDITKMNAEAMLKLSQ